MTLISEIDIHTKAGYRSFQLHKGDITNLGYHVDAIVVSAFKNNYEPIPRTVIGTLSQKGLSVKELANKPFKDFRSIFGAWMAENPNQDLNFNFLFCLEILGNDFSLKQALKNLFTVISIAEINEIKTQSIALPVLGTGNQMFHPKEIIEDLIKESFDFLHHARYLEKVILVAFDDKMADDLLDKMDLYLGKDKILIPKGEDIYRLKTDLINKIKVLNNMGVEGDGLRNFLDALERKDSGVYDLASTSRKALEFILKQIIRPNLKINLYERIKILSQSDIPKWYIQYFHLIRVFGNLNVHDNSVEASEDHFSTFMDECDVKIQLMIMDRILAFFYDLKSNKIHI